MRKPVTSVTFLGMCPPTLWDLVARWCICVIQPYYLISYFSTQKGYWACRNTQRTQNFTKTWDSFQVINNWLLVFYIQSERIFLYIMPHNQKIKIFIKKPLLSYFRTMKDHRIDRKKRHPLKMSYLINGQASHQDADSLIFAMTISLNCSIWYKNLNTFI